MTRLIDADKLHALFDKNCVGQCDVCNFYTSVHYVIHNKDCKGHSYCGLIDNAPTVEERPRGKWELHRKDLRVWFECSNCGAYNGGFETEYCSDCGADMRVTDNE